MSPERGDWDVDAEGNLTPPGGALKPDTDEFGRDDPDTLERERRRREREAQRKGGGRKPKKEKGVTGGFRKLRRGRRDDAPEPTRAAPEQAPTRPKATKPAAPPPKRRPGGPRGASYGRRRIAAVALALVGILVVWFLVALFQPFAGDGQGSGSVSVEIPDGASAGQIADILDKAGVISSGRLFQLRLKLAGKSDEVQADTYALAEGMSYSAAIDRLTGQASGPDKLNIPEGLSADQIAGLATEAGVTGDYVAASKQPPKGFDPAKYGSKTSNLEGFLFPATYDLAAGTTAEQLVAQQVSAFKDNVADVDFSYAKKKNLTVYDVLIIASMIEREASPTVPKERALVAAVIYNRLRKGIPLGIDATTRYEYKNYEDPITQVQLSKDTPYNTRLNSGLPPTPIGNPGVDAIKAAANPAQVNYIFYVAQAGTCEHFFTASETEFEAKAKAYQDALQAKGSSPTEC
jgi:peptidoglycan lytic transglycosylase G